MSFRRVIRSRIAGHRIRTPHDRQAVGSAMRFSQIFRTCGNSPRNSASYLIPSPHEDPGVCRARNAHLLCSILLTVPSDEMEPESLNLVQSQWFRCLVELLLSRQFQLIESNAPCLKRLTPRCAYGFVFVHICDPRLFVPLAKKNRRLRAAACGEGGAFRSPLCSLQGRYPHREDRRERGRGSWLHPHHAGRRASGEGAVRRWPVGIFILRSISFKRICVRRASGNQRRPGWS